MSKPYKLTKKMILDALPGTCGNRNALAKKLHVDWHTVDKTIARYPELEKALERERMQIVSLAEVKALELLKKGDGAMIRFILSTLGKNRGYSLNEDKYSLDGSTEEPIDKITIVDDVGDIDG